MTDYTVLVRCDFEASSPEKAAIQFVEWAAENVHETGLRVLWTDADGTEHDEYVDAGDLNYY